MRRIGYWGIGLPLGAILAFGTRLRGVGIWIGLASGPRGGGPLMLWRWLHRDRLGLVTATLDRGRSGQRSRARDGDGRERSDGRRTRSPAWSSTRTSSTVTVRHSASWASACRTISSGAEAPAVSPITCGAVDEGQRQVAGSSHQEGRPAVAVRDLAQPVGVRGIARAAHDDPLRARCAITRTAVCRFWVA